MYIELIAQHVRSIACRPLVIILIDGNHARLSTLSGKTRVGVRDNRDAISVYISCDTDITTWNISNPDWEDELNAILENCY
jgi:hypothetical protein